MKLEMICTGEEVLSGQIVDTNAAWLGNQLMDNGFEMHRRTTVGDRLEDLIEVFKERSHCADIILVNGGLGPTADDLSTQAMAEAMGVKLERNQVWCDRLVEWAAERGVKLTDSNYKQALLPEGAVLVDNPVGSACGFRAKLNGAWLFFTPGVPHEYKKMVLEQFIPFVQSEAGSQSKVAVTKLLSLGIGESDMAERLEKLIWPKGISLGYRAYMPYLELKLIARDVSQSEQNIAVQQAVAELGDGIVAKNQPTLASEVHELLTQAGKTLSIAESLTGGEVCSQLVNFPGSSRYLKQGVVSYCNEAKNTLLKVTEACLDEHSEVSLLCAALMAIGAAMVNTKIKETDFAIATTGVAGPASEHDKHPVGTVVIAVKAGSQVHCQMIKISSQRSRDYIREITVAIAFDMLRRAILNLSPMADYGYIKRIASSVYLVEDLINV
ncbi:CinA family nicotinamide mononucleotide deamidase-related protein [Psychromonas sp. RZ22]|uniref:CinA family nicotinamide mononucleotide deamidase-related protein n=1 Tax=Psychromonas algarum TaxID=2555643 RepID=UPI0010672C4D|nr:CinA family nicotinamide mononucleotide deamidase-related protein [Psychromonas sp. RZ22]TEW53325.1 CinA family nicotinamide mononucleotide deamidase-related protein [Psychromonas sp. RZ22]